MGIITVLAQDELTTTVNFVFRISKQEGSFHEERIVKMEEWQTKSAPLEQLFSEQGTKWEDDDDLESSDLETLRKYKQATQVGIYSSLNENKY